MRKILLSISMLFAMSANAQLLDCSELFISEYIEGPGNNNAIEIYNPTNASIDLSFAKAKFINLLSNFFIT